MISFSIIIATYNVGESIRKTFDSVLAQSYDVDKIEMVVVDGASTDSTVAIIKEYEVKFNGHFKWISEPDNGIYNAFNKGIRIADGQILNFKGAGDWLETDALAKVAKVFEKKPEIDAVVGFLFLWYGNSSYGQIWWQDPSGIGTMHSDCMHPTLFYRKKLHEEFGFYNEQYRIMADFMFCLKAFRFGGAKVERLYSLLAHFRKDGISSLNAKSLFAEEVAIRAACHLPPARRSKSNENYIKRMLKFLLPSGVLWIYRKWKEGSCSSVAPSEAARFVRNRT